MPLNNKPHVRNCKNACDAQNFDSIWSGVLTAIMSGVYLFNCSENQLLSKNKFIIMFEIHIKYIKITGFEFFDQVKR